MSATVGDEEDEEDQQDHAAYARKLHSFLVCCWQPMLPALYMVAVELAVKIDG